ncbi:hypothetical protein KX928_15535 [Roseobacter sp. YSTF-M11]|uniref:DUF1611 domain-containing protein n=1 Tax=Roseobacter insulae TaxID=2859783 RepID=A0A9X1FX04_9RHOB|nr:hypothetical protein [Roseobacter insulae]MBW4709203.1 hypothetical protein [Roseobacter insulae]
MTIHNYDFDLTMLHLNAKWAFTTRRVNHDDVAGLDPAVALGVAGDLVLCEITEINQHQKIQLSSGRAATSYLGDRVVLCIGDRYAPDQFEGAARITARGADLLAGGGVVGTMENAHARMEEPTKLRPVGLLTDRSGEVINIARYGLPTKEIPDDVTVIGVFGASMNAGKTTAAVSLAHGLSQAGFSVAGVKATGTGAFSDFNAFEDAGVSAMDFTDAGMPTTYRMPMDRIEQGFETLVGTAAANGAEVVVVEIADGVFQQETQEILAGSVICDRLDAILFATPDALGAVGGARVLADHGLRPFAMSGKLTQSPLAMMEARIATGIPQLSREDLCTPSAVMAVARGILRTAKLLQTEDTAKVEEMTAA